MAEESALKSRNSPSQRIDHRHTGGLPRAEHLKKSPQPGDSLENIQPAGLSDVDDTLLEWARNVLDNTPSVRGDVVRSLQIQIEAGLYSIDMEKLAERMVDHICRPLVIKVAE